MYVILFVKLIQDFIHWYYVRYRLYVVEHQMIQVYNSANLLSLIAFRNTIHKLILLPNKPRKTKKK